jgi:hypothetical protein
MSCINDNHRYFVADVATIQDQGKVVLIVLCTSCGESFSREFLVTSQNKNNKETK